MFHLNDASALSNELQPRNEAVYWLQIYQLPFKKLRLCSRGGICQALASFLWLLRHALWHFVDATINLFNPWGVAGLGWQFGLGQKLRIQEFSEMQLIVLLFSPTESIEYSCEEENNGAHKGTAECRNQHQLSWSRRHQGFWWFSHKRPSPYLDENAYSSWSISRICQRLPIFCVIATHECNQKHAFSLPSLPLFQRPFCSRKIVNFEICSNNLLLWRFLFLKLPCTPWTPWRHMDTDWRAVWWFVDVLANHVQAATFPNFWSGEDMPVFLWFFFSLKDSDGPNSTVVGRNCGK